MNSSRKWQRVLEGELLEMMASRRFDQAIELCEQAILRAVEEGDSLTYVQFGDHVRELYQMLNRPDEARKACARAWAKPECPLILGLDYMKLLLKLDRLDEARTLLSEMRERFEREKGEPEKQDVIPWENLNLLLAHALLSLRLRDRISVRTACDEIAQLSPALKESSAPFDRALILELVDAEEYHLARLILDVLIQLNAD
jgi:hypothetical protein